MLRKIAIFASLFCLLAIPLSTYAAASKNIPQKQDLAAFISQLPIIYLFDGMPPQPANCTVGNFGEMWVKLGCKVDLEKIDDDTFSLNVAYDDKVTKKKGIDHFIFLIPRKEKGANAILARYFVNHDEITGDQKNRSIWPFLSMAYREKGNLSKDYVLNLNSKGSGLAISDEDAPAGSAKADDFADSHNADHAVVEPDNPCGNVAANFPVTGDLRFILLATEDGYFPYYYSKKQNPDCGEEAKYVCAKVLKKQEASEDMEKAGVKAWQITIIHQCKGVDAPG